MNLFNIKPPKRHRFFFKAITKLYCKKLNNGIKDRVMRESPGDNFPGLYWRSQRT